MTRITNPLGETTQYEYDSLDLVTRVVDAAQQATLFSYDGNGNILSITDARNSVTSYIYDEMDRVTTRRDPLLHDVVSQYNAIGNVSQLTDRKNQVTQFTYDPLNRLTQVTYADSSTTTYTYDAVDRLTQVVDSISGTISYGYDNLDRVTSETTPQGTVSYTYDAAGRSTTITVLGQPTISYTYDDDSRLTQITQGTATVSITYNDAGERTSLTLPNGVVTEYEYDLASQLTKLTYKHAGNVLGDLSYEYDAAGRRTRMGGTFSRSVSPQPLSSATYNAANQQMTFGSQALTYDPNGNLTSDGENTYSWNARDQLTSVSSPGISAAFEYDFVGRRITKNINGAITSFLHDGNSVIQEQSTGLGTTNFLNGGLDEVFTRSSASDIVEFLRDGLGSSLTLTSNAGSIQTEYAYGAFGKSAEYGSSGSNSIQYTGRENDGTGLQYNRNRYYSPTLQRFISEDPIGF
ncbi:MAG TPA: RHS repeat-associated core domain-containing protein, partial [Anaerolineales bacterium]|nr:RHS repeat-associated core domain-containing protein [Anaerolineales bacterium]